MYINTQSKIQRTIQLRSAQLALALLLLATGLAINLLWFSAPVAAQSISMPGTITVVGEGQVTLEPDIALANIGVEVLNTTVAEASAENKELISSIIAALQEAGVAEKDIQTSGFNIYAERYGPEGPLSEDEVQYRVNNTVSVIIRDLDRVGDVLDAAIAAGANNINGVSFQVDDPGNVESDARLGAVEDAKAKAQELASLTGVSIGRVVSISEVVGGNSGYYENNFEDAMYDSESNGGGFAPGELSLSMRLQITYEIVETDAEMDTETEAEMDDEAATMPAPDTDGSMTELAGTQWTLSGIQQEGALATTDLDADITAQFDAERLFGSSGCNSYSTSYSVDAQSFILGPAISTSMACPDEIMAREYEFLQALGTVSGFMLDGDTLSLTDADGTVQLTFERAS